MSARSGCGSGGDNFVLRTVKLGPIAKNSPLNEANHGNTSVIKNKTVSPVHKPQAGHTELEQTLGLA
jgi:hypothetical protein